MKLMDVDVTLLERKMEKLEKQQTIANEKEKFYLTQISLLNKQIQQLQEAT